jgi:nucleoside-diphosphate-sugar epimerase
MKVAITGASGYVGTCLSNGFRQQGHEVFSLSRRRCAAPWLAYTMTDDPTVLPWNSVDVLIHAAYDFTAHTWDEILEKNVKPAVALFIAAKQAEVRHLIFISSMSSFNGCLSNYGKAKLIVEKEVLALGAIVIRPGLVWGDRSGGVMGKLEKLVTKLPIVPFLIGGKNLHQYLIHEMDLAAAIVAIAEDLPEKAGTLQTTAHPDPISLLIILKSIAQRAKQSRLYLPIPLQCAMAGLKFIEALGIRSMFRSDSLIGLVHGNPDPQFTAPATGIRYRRFD